MKTIQISIGDFVNTSDSDIKAFIVATNPDLLGITYILDNPISIDLSPVKATSKIPDYEEDEWFLFGHKGNARQLALFILNIQKGNISIEDHLTLSDMIYDFRLEVKQILLKSLVQPSRAMLYIIDGDHYLKRTFYEEAIICYKNAEMDIESLPQGFFRLYYNMGNAYYECGSFKKAIESYNKAIEVGFASEASKGYVYNNLGNAHYKLGEYYELEALKLSGDKSKLEDAVKVTANAIKEYELAEEYYDRSTEAETDTDMNQRADIALNKGNAYLALGRIHNLAIGLCELGENYYMDKQVKIAEKLLGIEENLKKTESREKFCDKAIHLYQGFCSSSYSNTVRTDAQNNLGCAYVQIKDYKNALASYIEAERLIHKSQHPNRSGRTSYARIQYNLACLHSRIDGQLSDKVKNCFKNAMEVDMSYAVKYYLHMLSSYVNVHDIEKVPDYINELIELNQRVPIARHRSSINIGDQYRQLNEFTKAIEAYENIINNIDCDNVEVKRKLGDTWYLMGALENDRDSLERADDNRHRKYTRLHTCRRRDSIPTGTHHGSVV